ncbi:MAG: hypothetical protein PVI97_19285 [Candidatus Thiodiazotropha sp.]|jgi:hypothetical protein
MKRLWDTIFYVVLATNATVAISGEGSPSEHVLLNGQIVPVFANVTRTQRPLESWDRVIMSINNYESNNKRSTLNLRSFPFEPKEGVYDKSVVRYERLCTVADSTNEMESVSSIVDVDAANGTFIIRATSPDNPDLIFDEPCELRGQVYRCDIPTQEVDFAFVGLDAVITIEGFSHGIWKEDKRYINIPRQKFSCTGADCGVEPASTLFGTLSELMPCYSLAIYEYEWQSAIP